MELAPVGGPARRLPLMGAFLAVVLLIAGLAIFAVRPDPAEAQTTPTLFTLWSGTLTAGHYTASGTHSVTGCSNTIASIWCVSRLTNSDFRFGGARLVHAVYVHTGSGNNPGRLLVLYQGSAWPMSLLSSAILVIDGRSIPMSTLSIDNPSNPNLGFLDNSGLTWTSGQTISLSILVPLSVLSESLSATPHLRSEYDWCFNRMSEQACTVAIHRWEQQAPQIALPASRRCPDTHRIRKATSTGVVCEQTYSGAGLPAGGGIAEAWGVIDIAPRSETSDAWDGTQRSCSPRGGHGYYNRTDITGNHGLGSGCHTHDNGTNFHEHTLSNH